MQKATPKHMVLTMSKNLLTPVVNKNIYGLKQVSRAWNTKFVIKYELQATTAYSCVFVNKVPPILIIVILWMGWEHAKILQS